MSAYIFAGVCVVICVIALFFAWKIYKDTDLLRKKSKKDEDVV